MGLDEFIPDKDLVRRRLKSAEIDIKPHKHSGLSGEWEVDSAEVNVVGNSAVIEFDETLVIEGDYDDVLDRLKGEVVVREAISKLSEELKEEEIPHAEDAQGFKADEDKYLKYLLELAFQGTATDKEIKETSQIEFNSQRTALKDKEMIGVVAIDDSGQNREVYAPTIEGYRALFKAITPAQLENREWFDELVGERQIEIDEIGQ